MIKKITPFLWFENNAEDAIKFYMSIFPDAKIVYERRNESGALFTASFELQGQTFSVLNGGPYFKFTEAISFFVDCETQEEVDFLWDKLSEGGAKSQCGWLKDKFGLSWQIIPSALGDLLGDPDPIKSDRVMQAMLQMTKIEISALEKAHKGE
jgi:predicted 3-demethylubiquinone-9 3-methyltransferase (glyoxalase superfamily)